MKRYKSNSQLKDLAKDRLTGHFGNALFALVLADMVGNAVSNVVISLLPTGTLFWSIISLLITAVISVFLGVLQTGIALYFLRLSCGQRPSYGDLFHGFQDNPERSIKVSIAHVVPTTICLLPGQITLLLFLRTMDYSYLLTAGICSVIGYLILIPVQLLLSQTYYLLLDFPDASAKETIKTGIRIMKGHKGRLFLLQLSFLPLQMLCILTLGIGYLWLNPYMRMTYTMFFLDLMNPEQRMQ